MGLSRIISRATAKLTDKARRDHVARQEFHCTMCGRVDVYKSVASPVHCGAPMSPGRALFKGFDPDAVNFDFVHVWPPMAFHAPKNVPAPKPGLDYWLVEEAPHSVKEVWVLKPGRQEGELLGWVAERATGWEYCCVRGIAESKRRGVSIDQPEAGYAMLQAVGAVREA